MLKHVTSVLTLAAFALAMPPAQAATSPAPVLLIKSVRSIDTTRNTVTFPVHKGIANGTTVWYILTDVSDSSEAKSRGLVFAPQLAGVRTIANVTAEDGRWEFPAAPDFSQTRSYIPGGGGFPPSGVKPGATARAGYSPFVKPSGTAAVYNAPIIATGDGPFDVRTHRNTADRVLALDPAAGTVTLLLADGFAAGKRVFYISTEASDPGAAAIERATYAPSIGSTPRSARLPIFVVANGSAQGLANLALHGNLETEATTATSPRLRTSHNVLGGLPAATADGGVYDPLWDAYVGVWSPAAITSGNARELTSAEDVMNAVKAKALTAPGGKAFGPAGFAVNCPVVAVAR